MNLLKHQQELVDTAPDRHGIFFDPGLGKTATCIALAKKHINNGHVLIITTKSLKANWHNEVKMWDVNNKTRKYSILSKEEFRKNWKNLPKAQCVLIDEAHYLGTPTSALHKAGFSYIRLHKPKYVYLATATPILASVMSVWALSRLLEKEVAPYHHFKRKYFNEVRMGFRVIPIQRKNIEQEIANELKSFGSVVSKEEALDLPDQIHEVEYFALNGFQKKQIKWLDKDPTTVNPSIYHTKCLQIASGTLKTDTGVIEIPCDKLDRLLELVEQNPNCVVVARHTAELEMLHKHIPNSFMFNGQTKEEDRQEIVNKVNNHEGVLLLQSDMGIGFNLTGVSMMIFYSHTYDFVKYTQCLSRTHRLGQKDTCVYIHLITQDTIDEDVYACLNRKESFDIALYNRTKAAKY